MCTDGLLNKLRCAQCRHKLDKFLDASIKAALIILGGVVFWGASNYLVGEGARSRPPQWK